MRYGVWGAARDSAPGIPTDRHFTGQTEDAISGLYWYQSRYYDATLGRFIQPDTIVPDVTNPQYLNRYAYCLNNPVTLSDPTGHDPWWSEQAGAQGRATSTPIPLQIATSSSASGLTPVTTNTNEVDYNRNPGYITNGDPVPGGIGPPVPLGFPNSCGWAPVLITDWDPNAQLISAVVSPTPVAVPMPVAGRTPDVFGSPVSRPMLGPWGAEQAAAFSNGMGRGATGPAIVQLGQYGTYDIAAIVRGISIGLSGLSWVLQHSEIVNYPYISPPTATPSHALDNPTPLPKPAPTPER